MEETAEMIKGVHSELIFLARAFFLGFMLRMLYDPLMIIRRIFHHRKWLISAEDILFWTFCSVAMFGLMFRENNGTPRLYALAGIAAGMIMYHEGPGRLVSMLFGKLRAKTVKLIYQISVKRLKKRQKYSMIGKTKEKSEEIRVESRKRQKRRKIGRKDGSSQEG